MIVILGCLKINMEISDVSVKTTVFGEYREVLRVDEVTKWYIGHNI